MVEQRPYKALAGGSNPSLSTVGVAQLVRALGCGPGCREFDPRHSPEVSSMPGYPSPVKGWRL
jgi:hypothetical protein